MKIYKSTVHSHQIVIDKYQVNPTEAFKLSEIGLAMNCSTGQVIIHCPNPVTDEDVEKVKQYLSLK